MESLLANYASSEEEEEKEEGNLIHSAVSSSSSKPVSSSSSSLFSSLPKPKFDENEDDDDEDRDQKPSLKSTATLFSSIPKPKTTQSVVQPVSDYSNKTTKRVVHFKLPVNPNHGKPADFDDDDEDEDEQEKNRNQRRDSESESQTPSVMSFLSSIPAPKNSSSFGILPSAGRRSVVGIETTPSSASGTGNDQSTLNNESASDPHDGNYVNYSGYESGMYNQETGQDGSSYGGYESNSNCGNYNDYYYGQYDNNWSGDGLAAESTASMPQIMMPSESGLRVPGKRRRNEIPTEIIEVKQDELTKDRPREDQVKLTGIAFGPSYQPTSTKGKPSKLHKRKHQIGSLFFDMKQKELELAERRAKGFLTKAQTQAKYGW